MTPFVSPILWSSNRHIWAVSGLSWTLVRQSWEPPRNETMSPSCFGRSEFSLLLLSPPLLGAHVVAMAWSCNHAAFARHWLHNRPGSSYTLHTYSHAASAKSHPSVLVFVQALSSRSVVWNGGSEGTMEPVVGGDDRSQQYANRNFSQD